MPKIKGTNRVHCWCERHKSTTEHVEYLFEPPTPPKYVCVECKHQRPHEYPLYGRQSPKLELEKPKKQQMGRIVA